jgi:plastocyanin
MRLAVGSLLFAIGLTACSSAPTGSSGGNKPAQPPPPGAGSAAVTISTYSYSPGVITITAGGSVKWTNTDPVTHSVTADAGGFASDLSGSMPDQYGGTSGGGTFSHTFASSGSFAYHCIYHSAMHGTVTVNP